MTELDMKRLKDLTNLLLQKNHDALGHFKVYRLDGESTADFEGKILPFANEVKVNADEWIELAIQYIRKEKPKYVHENQIEDVHENILIQSVTCFQKDTKKKRFLEQNKSIEYTLNALDRELE
ncbi:MULTISPECIES: DUF1798 family protein [Bacillaceae]|uniref:YppE family protein n=1 Tax=Evansella alkalicola TaxID=745819 RepID=A0ABS6K2D0_9BACI|nr:MULTISPECIES: DUF1798 family protein [Bacillaceae]MBU9723900.1 YppE family protein [Bacillus alkalicola]